MGNGRRPGGRGRLGGALLAAQAVVGPPDGSPRQGCPEERRRLVGAWVHAAQRPDDDQGARSFPPERSARGSGSTPLALKDESRPVRRRTACWILQHGELRGA